MEQAWLYPVVQCVVSVAVVVVSVRLCVFGGGGSSGGGGSVSSCLRLCLGWVGALGGAAGVPVTVLLSLRSPRCVYACVALVCCPLLVRQFSVCLMMLLSLDQHLKIRLQDRYPSVVTRVRALSAVLLCWVGSVLSSFAQFLGRDIIDVWGGSAGLGMDGGNWTSPAPPPPWAPQERSVIGMHLPYGGFLSKFYVQAPHNLTYAQIHAAHWGVCAPDAVLSPRFLVCVYAVTAFLLPFLVLLALHLDMLLCGHAPCGHAPPAPAKPRPLSPGPALTLSLLVLLCLPLQIAQAMLLLTPPGAPPATPRWAWPLVSVLAQSFDLVPPLLFLPPRRQRGGGGGGAALAPPPVTAPRGKAVGRALCDALQGAAWRQSGPALNAKVCPGV